LQFPNVPRLKAANQADRGLSAGRNSLDFHSLLS
jgi:hypothetical protein